MEGYDTINPEQQPFWADQALKKPLFFSVGLHLAIALIVFMPTSLFHQSPPPIVYSVQLIDLSDPLPAPKLQPVAPPEQVAPKIIPKEPAVSTKPILSTRNIPKTPSEIKILRPRKIKRDLRKDKPPIDQSMVFAALERMRKQEQILAKQELELAEEEVKKANDDALQALRSSILSRQPDPYDASSVTQNQQGSPASGLQQGQRANTILSQYTATMGQHIGEFWRLPEGQKWATNLNTIVIVKIKDDGIVISSKIDVASKSKQFDRFVIETIEKASPLPPIPDELPNTPLKLHFYPQGLQ